MQASVQHKLLPQGVRSRNSSTVPNFQPIFSSRLCFALCIAVTFAIVQSNPTFARLLRQTAESVSLFLKYFKNYDGIIVNPIHNAPRTGVIVDSEFMAPLPIEGIGRDQGIGSRSPCCICRSRNPVSSRAADERGRSLDFSVQPHQGFCRVQPSQTRYCHS